MTDTPPEQLPERELFTEYVELRDQRKISGNTYEEVNQHQREGRLLAEIGERLEALEAAKALLDDPNEGVETQQPQTDRQRQSTDSHQLSFDDE